MRTFAILVTGFVGWLSVVFAVALVADAMGRHDFKCAMTGFCSILAVYMLDTFSSLLKKDA